MISDGKKWQKIAVKSLSALLRGITWWRLLLFNLFSLE